MKTLAVAAVALAAGAGLVLGWLDVGSGSSTEVRPTRSTAGQSGPGPADDNTERRLLDTLAGLDQPFHWDWQPDEREAAATDPVAEFHAALAMSNVMARRLRLRDAVAALAESNPLLALDLIETIPNELTKRGMSRLAVDIWAERSPDAAAAWLVEAPPGIARLALPSLARHWGTRDFASASGFADRLSGTLRTGYLYRLARIERPRDELLAWAAKYRNDPAHPGITVRIIQHLGDDVDAMLTLLGALSGPAFEEGAKAAIQRVARANPDAALELVASLTGNAWRLYPDLIAGFAQNDPDRAAAFLTEQIAEVRDKAHQAGTLPGVIYRLVSNWAATDANAALRWSLRLDPWLRDSALTYVAIHAHHQRPSIARRAFDAIARNGHKQRAIDGLIRMAATDEDALRTARNYDHSDVELSDIVRLRSSFGRGGVFDVDCPRGAVAYGQR